MIDQDTLDRIVNVQTELAKMIGELANRVSKLEGKHPDNILQQRYNESSRVNRGINEPPARVALAAYLMDKLNVPQYQIVASGLLTQSRIQGLKSWDAQHYADYMDICNVRHIYENGMPISEMNTYVPNITPLLSYLPKVDAKTF